MSMPQGGSTFVTKGWTPAMDKLLRYLLIEENLSASWTAKRINDAKVADHHISRSAVIGRKHRLGLNKLMAPNNYQGEPRKKSIRMPSKPVLGGAVVVALVNAPLRTKPLLKKISLPKRQLTIKQAASSPVIFSKREYDGSCQHIAGCAPDFDKCGQPSKGPYCEEHRQAMYDWTAKSAIKWRRKVA